ncbi:beta-lactamase hydrolase domain-containing protein [Pseudooceanicola sp.]|uniref:beta-lactamase hydrolase domain-containing protein n=1 Tax=Pseudooceanicola sp. TaxID=1914328 RepID=UPI003511186B
MTQIVTIDSNHIVALFAPDEAALRQAASAGTRSVVNFRAADEAGGLSLPDERRVAERAGLNYLHHPVTAAELDDDNVDDFRRSLDDLPQPVFLHCASGKLAGAMALMAVAAENGWDGATALATGRDRGLDLSEDEIGTFVRAYADRKAGL